MKKLETLAEKYFVFNVLFFVLIYIYRICISIVSFIFRIFPIDDKKIVFCNMKGKRYGDNPKYICDEIIKRGLDYQCVWLLRNCEEVDSANIIVKKYSLIRNLYHLCTAKIWVDSNTKYLGILKRKKQIYIQTWHGSYGLKKIGMDLPGDYLGKEFIKYNSKIADIMVSNSKQCSEIFRRAFWYNGKIIEKGSPRNDVFNESNDKFYQKVSNYFHCEGKKMVLYAPTYRSDLSLDAFDLDFQRLRANLEKKFGNEWVVLVRLHPNNIELASQYITYDQNIINATDYDVMQELLVACDILITDYSSCMFDFVTKPKICMLYASDIMDYGNERGWYFDLKDLPFPLSSNNDELEQNIENFSYDVYRKKIYDLHEQVGLNETGNASGAVVDYIEECEK